MPSISVTINTPASGPFALDKLFAGNTYLGAVTVAPVAPGTAQSKPGIMSIQADPGNSTNYVIVGDKNITSTTGGKRLNAGTIDTLSGPDCPRLVERFINGSAAGVIANIEVWGGKQ